MKLPARARSARHADVDIGRRSRVTADQVLSRTTHSAVRLSSGPPGTSACANTLISGADGNRASATRVSSGATPGGSRWNTAQP